MCAVFCRRDHRLCQHSLGSNGLNSKPTSKDMGNARLNEATVCALYKEDGQQTLLSDDEAGYCDQNVVRGASSSPEPSRGLLT